MEPTAFLKFPKYYFTVKLMCPYRNSVKFELNCVILQYRNDLTVLIHNDLTINYEKISHILEKFLNSKTLTKPGVYKNLLNYLVNYSLKGKTFKQ